MTIFTIQQNSEDVLKFLRAFERQRGNPTNSVTWRPANENDAEIIPPGAQVVEFYIFSDHPKAKGDRPRFMIWDTDIDECSIRPLEHPGRRKAVQERLDEFVGILKEKFNDK